MFAVRLHLGEESHSCVTVTVSDKEAWERVKKIG